MKLKIFQCLAAALLSFSASSAFATWYATTYSYDVTFDFSSEAWGKSVKQVYAHTGVLEEGNDAYTGQVSYYWSSVKHVPMSLQGDRFVGFAQVSGETGGGSGSYTIKNRGAVVQYWVYFTDGTSLVTDVVSVPVRRMGVAAGRATSATCLETPYLASPRECL